MVYCLSFFTKSFKEKRICGDIIEEAADVELAILICVDQEVNLTVFVNIEESYINSFNFSHIIVV